jgi:hypothetical protein
LQFTDLLQPANLRHSFQAPTLIGCQIFKEQGISYSVVLVLGRMYYNLVFNF